MGRGAQQKEKATYTPPQDQNEKLIGAMGLLDELRKPSFVRICFLLGFIVYPPCPGLAYGYLVRCRESFIWCTRNLGVPKKEKKTYIRRSVHFRAVVYFFHVPGGT